VQLTELAPFAAVIVTRSPALPPLDNDIVGVESVVTLSVFELPVSEEAAKSGAPGAIGDAVSTIIDIEVPALDWFPARSVNLPETVHVPSESAGIVHEVAGPTT
jgi:hypothetical protein